MANNLDELSINTRPEGVDTRVIAKRIPAEVGIGSRIFEILLWVCFVIPGLLFQLAKIRAENYFQQLEQKIQYNASQIDNYLEERVIVLKNAARLLEKSIALDKETFEKVAKARTGGMTEEERNNLGGQLNSAFGSIMVAVESYPELQTHQELAAVIKQNLLLQQQISAARTLYNDSVNQWNASIFQWPARQIVAAKNGYTTRIPFAAEEAVREMAKETLF